MNDHTPPRMTDQAPKLLFKCSLNGCQNTNNGCPICKTGDFTRPRAALTRPTPAERPFNDQTWFDVLTGKVPPSALRPERPVPQVREVEHLLADIIANETYADNDGVAGISAAAEAICEKFEIHPLTSERPSDATEGADTISLPRWWLELCRDQLFAMGKLPPGDLGNWVFLFREQLRDAIERRLAPDGTLIAPWEGRSCICGVGHRPYCALSDELSDGAIYAAVSKRDASPDELAQLNAEIDAAVNAALSDDQGTSHA